MLWHGLPGDFNKKGQLKADAVCIDAFFQMVKDNMYKIQYRVMMSRYRGKTVCPTCHGTRLKKEATWVKIGGRAITELVDMPIDQLSQWFDKLTLTEHELTGGPTPVAGDKVTARLLVRGGSRLPHALGRPRRFPAVRASA